MTPVEALTPKQLIAAQALACGFSIAAAAAASGTGEKTIDRWLKLPEFQIGLKAIRQDLYQVTINALVGASTDAVKTLRTIAQDPSAPPAARVTAARTILDQAGRAQGEAELLQRLEALEDLLNKEHP
ncbi:hypothetical protein [Candidatus Cyanaurora vandensis]|uniref:hypothetical protein n=1 Tax=Candidatus Cyanaurora vandensis TaxID=2714958 RepID=UPI00257C52D4|nr:hypothetical protein [Candidatus Cyanaurora vandensis]